MPTVNTGSGNKFQVTGGKPLQISSNGMSNKDYLLPSNILCNVFYLLFFSTSSGLLWLPIVSFAKIVTPAAARKEAKSAFVGYAYSPLHKVEAYCCNNHETVNLMCLSVQEKAKNYYYLLSTICFLLSPKCTIYVHSFG